VQIEVKRQETIRPFRVLCIDGGGIRGLYSAALLDTLIKRVRPSRHPLDVGKAFDLIVGTSTGGILAVGLAYGLSLQNIIDLYTTKGSEIFSNPMPRSTYNWPLWAMKRRYAAKTGQAVLGKALDEQFLGMTVKQLYKRRGIAVCIPAVRMANRKAWVFKTPHIGATADRHAKHRDNEYKLSDVCLATAAAPIIFPLVALDNPDDRDRYDVFTDGGLWANNPSLIGIIEALEITESKRNIQVISMSTASPPSGKVIDRSNLNYGMIGWKAGVGALETCLDAQASGAQFMSRFLIPHLKANVELIRLAYDAPSNEQALCIGLDRADKNAITALTDMARSDAETNILGVESRHSQSEIRILEEIINSMPMLMQ